MRMNIYLALGVAIALVSAAPLAAQATETFESATPGSPGTYPTAWTDGGGVRQWFVDSGGTPSGTTGPSVDHTLGTSAGIYMYCETSSPAAAGDTYILNVREFDTTGVATLDVQFWYHMFGATIGTLELQQFNGGAWTQIWSLSGDQGNSWQMATAPLLAGGTNVQLRFHYVRGTSFTGDAAIDDVTVPGSFNPLPFEDNSPEAGMLVDGVATDGLSPAVVNKSLYLCPTPVPATGTFQLQALNNPGAFYEVVFSSNPILIPSAINLFGEVVNIDISVPLSYLNGGAAFIMEELPGAASPGATGASMGTIYSQSSPTDTALQGAFTSPAGAAGFEVTQGTEFHVAALPIPASVPGPTGDDQVLSYDLVNAPTCWTASGLPFYGTLSTELFVDSNGRVMTAPDGSDFSPTIPEAQSGPPTVGVWTDLSPNLNGTITVSNPVAGIVRVDWNGVANFGASGSLNTFGVQLDEATGTVVIDGLAAGLDPANLASNIFIGMTPGNGATDPGTTTFAVGGAPGGAGVAALVTDMLYDFSTSSVGLPASIDGTLGAIEFLAGLGNYAWQGL